MTNENIVADLDDVKAVTFECRVGKCRARLTVPIITTEKMRVPEQCPYCTRTWINSEQKSSHQPETQQMAFVSALEKVKAEGNASFRIFLEFEIPPQFVSIRS